jgi:1-acyl-sn-glycerol-3-phosphate acyltransferase
MKWISLLIFKLLGWRIKGVLPAEIKKCVIVAAPHTSNWDFILGRLAYFIMGVPVRFLIKKEAFKPPYGGLLKKMGGISVDRSRSNNLVEDVAALFDKHDVLYVVITPEGTRKLVHQWRKGFYYIAMKAKVPVALGFVDYKKKEGGFGPVFYPSGDFDADFDVIREFYKHKTARNPELFNLSPQYLK